MIKTNSDYLFILGTQNDKVVKALWDEFGGLGFDDWRAFRSHAAAAVQISVPWSLTLTIRNTLCEE